MKLFLLTTLLFLPSIYADEGDPQSEPTFRRFMTSDNIVDTDYATQYEPKPRAVCKARQFWSEKRCRPYTTRYSCNRDRGCQWYSVDDPVHSADSGEIKKLHKVLGRLWDEGKHVMGECVDWNNVPIFTCGDNGDEECITQEDCEDQTESFWLPDVPTNRDFAYVAGTCLVESADGQEPGVCSVSIEGCDSSPCQDISGKDFFECMAGNQENFAKCTEGCTWNITGSQTCYKAQCLAAKGQPEFFKITRCQNHDFPWCDSGPNDQFGNQCSWHVSEGPEIAMNIPSPEPHETRPLEDRLSDSNTPGADAAKLLDEAVATCRASVHTLTKQSEQGELTQEELKKQMDSEANKLDSVVVYVTGEVKGLGTKMTGVITQVEKIIAVLRDYNTDKKLRAQEKKHLLNLFAVLYRRQDDMEDVVDALSQAYGTFVLEVEQKFEDATAAHNEGKKEILSTMGEKLEDMRSKMSTDVTNSISFVTHNINAVSNRVTLLRKRVEALEKDVIEILQTLVWVRRHLTTGWSVFIIFSILVAYFLGPHFMLWAADQFQNFVQWLLQCIVG